jgi:hypothetical protein
MRGSPGGEHPPERGMASAHKLDASEPGRTVSGSPPPPNILSSKCGKQKKETAKDEGEISTSLPRKLPIQASEQRGRPKGPSPRQPHSRLDPSPILAWPMMCENLISSVGRQHEFVCPTSFRKLVVIGSMTGPGACIRRSDQPRPRSNGACEISSTQRK